ncbi:MAG: tRNA 2-thiouridine(34) synthase MnmA [Lentisphaeria bacterium]|nr:tRNA 2-thiouridine(34) synthase MnmA [Lentisphaeria bacterium]
MKIAVGLSGGVDSSVAAALLASQGHEVVGVTMKLWREGRYRGGDKDACFGPGEAEDIARAEKLCRQLGIEYHVFDCADEYEKVVLEYFRSEYLAGKTPNPCVRCNAFMKFGVLPNLARSSGIAFDKFATGHYARLREENGVFRLLRGTDEKKDQSYFLYRLKQSLLANLIFPLGAYRKSEVRELAAKFGLEVKDKPDSQDFYSGDHTELLNTPPKVGNIVDTSGQVLGTHEGFWNYTIGQRKGLGVAAAHPLYVVELDPCRNEVVVGSAEEVVRHELRLADCSWIVEEPRGEVAVKVRSVSKLLPAVFEDGVLKFPDGVAAAARGQSAVLYRNDEVLGGGIIAGVR